MGRRPLKCRFGVVAFELAVGLRGGVFESGEFVEPDELHVADRAVALLGDDDLGLAFDAAVCPPRWSGSTPRGGRTSPRRRPARSRPTRAGG